MSAPTHAGRLFVQCPRGGALLMNLMGGCGNFAIAMILPFMDSRLDQAGPGAAMQSVSGPSLRASACCRVRRPGLHYFFSDSTIARPASAGLFTKRTPAAVSADDAGAIHPALALAGGVRVHVAAENGDQAAEILEAHAEDARGAGS
jgi:hypothetical protein